VNPVKLALAKHRVLVVISLILLAAGVHALLTMPRRSTPEITIQDGLVIALYPGATAEQVEKQLTNPLEQYLFSKKEINQQKTISRSLHSQSIITVELNDWVKNTDTFWSELQIGLAQIRLTKLPETVIGPLVNSDFGDVVALLIGAHSSTQSPETLQRSLHKVADSLRSLDATSKVFTFGYQPEAIYVSADSQALIRYGVTLEQVVTLLRRQNSVRATGSLETNKSLVPLHVTGSYSTVDSIANQRILVLPTGEEVRIGDVAKVELRRADPSLYLRINAKETSAQFLGIEMEPGSNIVQFGNDIRKALAELQPVLPSDITFTFINDQPQIVEKAVADFEREFLIAIGAVILVIMLLLPIRVAAIAAMAIPVTVAVTFQILDLIGIPLHEVSLASMIVVLGMVVDDAVVIADNYLEKLDEGFDRYEAAYRSASELFVPVLTATLAIIAAFAPLGFVLTGAVGEFIFALPVTVTVALSVSFIIAMLLTPFLCYTFITTGLQKEKGDDHGSLLETIQKGYKKLLLAGIRFPALIVITAISVSAAGVFLLLQTDQKLFPVAERAQCIIEVDMGIGASLEATNSAVKLVEKEILNNKLITNFASFIGIAPPRVYYSFAPEFPRKSYGCILVNTQSPKATEELVENLQLPLENLVPGALINIQMFDQGPSVPAPIEIRISGYELPLLEELGDKISAITAKANGTREVQTNFKQEWGASVQVNEEMATIYGFTTADISPFIKTAFEGTTISRLYDNDRTIDIVFRLTENLRHDFNSLGDLYLRSPLTNDSTPLKNIASIAPTWNIGQISHRNGLRTLAVLAHTRPGIFAENILKQITQDIRDIPLPPGYHIAIGGEHENVLKTFGQMGQSLIISTVLIFLILLIQFGNVTESLIVMLAIPLTILGAAIGLLVTSNPLGFTASIGIASLIGIVIRNSIILVDYADSLVKSGMDVRNAAITSAIRRMRPIFLTSLAAAVGVIPMIISGSPLWAPLASVFAVGVLFSMVMTLLVIPVVYNLIMTNRLHLLTRNEEQK